MNAKKLTKDQAATLAYIVAGGEFRTVLAKTAAVASLLRKGCIEVLSSEALRADAAMRAIGVTEPTRFDLYTVQGSWRTLTVLRVRAVG